MTDLFLKFHKIVKHFTFETPAFEMQLSAGWNVAAGLTQKS